MNIIKDKWTQDVVTKPQQNPSPRGKPKNFFSTLRIKSNEATKIKDQDK